MPASCRNLHVIHRCKALWALHFTPQGLKVLSSVCQMVQHVSTKASNLGPITVQI